MSATHIFRTTGWLCIAAIVVWSIFPEHDQPSARLPGHFEQVLAYTFTAGVLGFGYRKAAALLTLFCVLVALAATLEFVQLVSLDKHAEFVQLGASSVGAALGLLGAAFVNLILFDQYPDRGDEWGAWPRDS
jgi:hypothetical protein